MCIYNIFIEHYVVLKNSMMCIYTCIFGTLFMEHYAVLKNSSMCVYTCIFGTLIMLF